MHFHPFVASVITQTSAPVLIRMSAFFLRVERRECPKVADRCR